MTTEAPAVEVVSVLFPRSRKELLLLPVHVVLVTGLLILCLFYLKAWEVPAVCLNQDKLLRGTWEMRSDSFCNYTASVTSVNKTKEFGPHSVTGSLFEITSFFQCN